MQEQQKNFTESLGEYCQCVTKPIVDMTRLSFDTLNHLARNTACIDSFMQAKKPEDILAAQIKLANAIGVESFNYMQKATAILMDAANQNGKIFAEAAKDSVAPKNTYESEIYPGGQSKKRKVS